ncbi:MAG: AAA family ATPase, partial [Deltaproteobacteria bacterium]|nr:AAA family ATPase [Deltaproteobacteria bacterium]
MASVWVLLGKARFQNAELVRSSVEAGVETVHIPFEISAEFSPAIARAADERLAKLTEGLPPKAPEFDHIVHQCAEMKKLVAQARTVALRDVPVLIEGETGTGKELFARAIHEASPRKEKKFISVNCGAIPKELFEAEFFGHKK